MKKIVVITLILLLAGAFAASAASEEKFVLGVGTGLYYDAYLYSSNPVLGFFSFILNLRGEGYVNFTYKFADIIGVGAEAGIAYITDGGFVGLFDFPIRAIGTIDLKLITIQPFAGLFLTAWNVMGVPFGLNFEAGARVVLFGSFTGLYVEGSYVMGPTTFWRAGLGYQVKLFGF